MNESAGRLLVRSKAGDLQVVRDCAKARGAPSNRQAHFGPGNRVAQQTIKDTVGAVNGVLEELVFSFFSRIFFPPGFR